MSDTKRAIGSYTLCNVGSILVYAIDYTDDQILAGINEDDPTWVPITEKFNDYGEPELGFSFSGMFVPFSQVMRV